MPTAPTSFMTAPFSRKGRGAVTDTAIDTYEMTNLSPRMTGLQLVVWVSPKGHARHDARIKISLTPGKMDIDTVAVVGIRPEPREITRGLTSSDFEQIARWIKLNETALLEFWDDKIDTGQLLEKLQKI